MCSRIKFHFRINFFIKPNMWINLTPAYYQSSSGPTESQPLFSIFPIITDLSMSTQYDTLAHIFLALLLEIKAFNVQKQVCLSLHSPSFYNITLVIDQTKGLLMFYEEILAILNIFEKFKQIKTFLNTISFKSWERQL